MHRLLRIRDSARLHCMGPDCAALVTAAEYLMMYDFLIKNNFISMEGRAKREMCLQEMGAAGHCTSSQARRSRPGRPSCTVWVQTMQMW